MKSFFLLIFVSALVISPFSRQQIARSRELVFNDISSDNSYYDAALYFKGKNIVTGFADGTFGITKPMSRAEFVALAMKASEYAGSGSNCFTDVLNQWYAPFVCQAKELGFVDGYANGSFGPDDAIALPTAAVIATRVFELTAENIDDSRWFGPYILALEKAGAIPLQLRDFDLPMGRGDAVEMLYRLAAKIDNKPSHAYKKLAERDDVKKALGMDLPKMPPGKAFKRIIQKARLSINEAERIDGVDEEVLKEAKLYLLLTTICPEWTEYEFEIGGDSFAYLLGHNGLAILLIPSTLEFKVFPQLLYHKDTAGAVPVSRLRGKSVIFDSRALYRVNSDLSLTHLDGIDIKTFSQLFSYEGLPLSRKEAKLLPIGGGWKFISPSSHSFLNLYKDRSAVYQMSLEGTLDEITDIDMETVRTKKINEANFLFDKNTVFLLDHNAQLQKIADADPASFSGVSDAPISYFRDEDSIFYATVGPEGRLKKLEPIKDIRLNEADIISQTIYRQGGKVYTFSPEEPEATEIEGADARNFRVVDGTNNELFSDDKNIYFYSIDEMGLSKIASAKGFELLQSGPSFDFNYYEGPRFVIFKNHQTVFVPDSKNGYTALKGVDINSFRLLDFRDAIRIAQDKKGFYAGNGTLKFIKRLDMKFFERIGSNGVPVLFRDLRNIYRIGNDGGLEAVQDIDASSFEIIHDSNNFVAKDKNHVYLWKGIGTWLETAPELTATHLKLVSATMGSVPVFKDDTKVFYVQKGAVHLIEGADVGSFTAYPENRDYFRDKRSVWMSTRLQGSDSTTFSRLEKISPRNFVPPKWKYY